MDDRTRFRITGYATNLSLLVWFALGATALAAVFFGVRGAIRGNFALLRIAILVLAALYALWLALTAAIARLITNNSKGYRPWEWGMVPRNEAGRGAQEFNIPLTHAEAADSFGEPSAIGDTPPNSA